MEKATPGHLSPEMLSPQLLGTRDDASPLAVLPQGLALQLKECTNALVSTRKFSCFLGFHFCEELWW